MKELTRALTMFALFCMAGAQADAADWTEKVKVKGDLRYRHEYTDQEGALERHRQRVRARIGIEANLDDGVKLAFRLASGSSDPVSTNQTLDGAFSTKGIGLDLAYFEWKPETAKGLSVNGGKIKNPFFKPGKAEMIWDGDLNPEGMALKFESKEGKTQFFATVGGFWIDESSSGADAGLRAAQAGLIFNLNDGQTTVTVGGSLFDYSNLAGYPTVFDAADSFGNSVDSLDLYVYDYNLMEVFAEVSIKAGETPLSFFGDFVSNSDPDSANTGWLVGANIGTAKKTGTWEGRYYYRKVEMDAVLGVFTDSDFRGGGTNGEGHEFGLSVMAAKKVKLGASLFINKRDLIAKTDFNRVQFDANFKL